MKAYINRADKIADGQFDDKLDCARVTKVRGRSKLKNVYCVDLKNLCVRRLRQKLKIRASGRIERWTKHY